MSTNPNILRIQAKTLDKALIKASELLKVNIDKINYKIISQTDAGIFSFLGLKQIEIDAWVNSQAVNASNKTDSVLNDLSNSESLVKYSEVGMGTPAQSEQGSMLNEEEQDDSFQDFSTNQQLSKISLTEDEKEQVITNIKKFCKGLCKFFTDKEIEIEFTLQTERLIINIKNKDIADMFSANPKVIGAFEHILRKTTHYLKKELSFTIFVDSFSKRIKREQDLIELAKNLSKKVAKNNKPIALYYKNPYDRKIIHMTLDKDKHVYTKSVGVGHNRKLLILPVNSKNIKKYDR